MRVVLDTNILVSALFWDGNERAVLTECRKKRFELVLSPEILLEVERVLDKKFECPEERLTDYIRTLLAMSELVFPGIKLDVIRRDPSDNRILECASCGNAEVIVTGNNDLLELGEYGAIQILTAKELLGMKR
jgi:putative PIN family toxin of toxin-antitoxin system